jgi:cell division transport system ATP-binding protein
VPIITFETVSKEFTPESFGLKDISFTVEPGELIFITGHSGSGKTTLMRLTTKYTPTEARSFKTSHSVQYQKISSQTSP